MGVKVLGSPLLLMFFPYSVQNNGKGKNRKCACARMSARV
jgi:hypothetical protein